MQFKVVTALIFATLAAASAVQVPRADTNIAPPFPDRSSISGSECSDGHLRCCKFHFHKIVIVLRWKRTIIGKSGQSPTSPAVPPLLHPLGISPSSISGLVGITCTALPANAKRADWFVSIGSMNDLNLIIFLASSDAPLCCTDNSHGMRSAITTWFFYLLIILLLSLQR